MRSNPTYYINPNSISVTPNANGNANDLAVYIQRDTKIKVFVDGIVGYDEDGNYQEWSFAGKNRRLNDSGGTFTGPFTIYARCVREDKSNGYLIFARQVPVTVDGQTKWLHKYQYMTPTGLSKIYDPVTCPEGDCYGPTSVSHCFLLGEVSPIGTDPGDTETYGKRTVTLDTGILGTDQYNNEWKAIEDSQPLRVEVGNSLLSNPPFIGWGGDVRLEAHLVKGWETPADDRIDHWTIERNTGDETADEDWNQGIWPDDSSDNASDSSGEEPHDDPERRDYFGETGVITLNHKHDGRDDFNSAVSAMFTIKAWGYDNGQSDGSSSDSSEEPELVVLAQDSITILAEAEETYDIAMSDYAMHYDPHQIAGYSPATIRVQVKATKEDGTVSYADKAKIDNAGLTLTYFKNNTSYELSFDNDGNATLPSSVFADKMSHTLTLRRGGTPLASATVAFVQDGTDGADADVWTIGSDGYWYCNGEKTNTKAEGKDGTGVELKGSVDVLNASDAQAGQTSLENLTGMAVGDCYVVDSNRHLYFYNGVGSWPSNWNDLGEFKGEDGVSSYMHMAWAKNIVFDEGSSDSSSSDSSEGGGLTPISASGFTVVYDGYDYDWIGFCTDNNENDPTDFRAYKWNYQKGKDGDGYEYVYMRAAAETAPTIYYDTYTDGDKTYDRTKDEYRPAVSNYSSGNFADSRFTDDPRGVSEQWPFEYQAVRKKVNGAWEDFSPATLHRKYGEDGVQYFIDTTIDSITIPSGASSATFEIAGSFYQQAGGGAKTPFTCSFVMARLRAGVRTRLANAIDVSSFSAWEGTAIAGDAIEIFLWRDSIDPTYATYFLKKTIPVIKDGDDGQDGADGRDGADGMDGTDGKDAASVDLSKNLFLYDANNAGQATGQQAMSVGIRFNVGGTYRTITAGDITISNSLSGVTASTPTISGTTATTTLTVANAATPSGTIGIAITATYDGVTYMASAVITVAPNKQGATGAAGKMGRSYYFAGDFDASDNVTQFDVTDAQAPFFRYLSDSSDSSSSSSSSDSSDSGSGIGYWVYNPAANPSGGTITMQAMGTPSEIDPNWQRMTDRFDYLITKAIFADYAKFGSAIFNGDWLLSANGQIWHSSVSADTSITGVVFDPNGNNGRFSMPPHALFSPDKPTSDGEKVDENDTTIHGEAQGSTAYAQITSQTYTGGIPLVAGTTYYIRTDALSNGYGNYSLQIYASGIHYATIANLKTPDMLTHTNVAYFRVAVSGTYSLRVEIDPEVGRKSAIDIYFWSLIAASFAPRYAVDLFTGLVIQGYGFSSGAIRRSKVIIDNATYNYYTKPIEGNAGYRYIDIDSCGSFVEIKQSNKPCLQLPMFCTGGKKVAYNPNSHADYETYYTDEDRDYARSFVGTKVLIYITNGGLSCHYKKGSEISIYEDEFVYEQSNDTDTSGYSNKAQEVREGQFLELECCTGTDAFGEIVYWRVNTRGNIATQQRPSNSSQNAAPGDSSSESESSSSSSSSS